VVVDFGAGTTKVAVMDYGILRLSHTIGKGSQDLSHAIARSLEVDFEKAEDIKRRLGLIAPATTEQILGSVSPILEHIFADINRVIVNYQTRSRKAISRVVFTGGGTMLKGFLELAQKNFEMPVELSAPFERVEYPQFMAEIMRKAGPDFAVAVGLAIRKLQD
jgi:cell division ATPase FtsA